MLPTEISLVECTELMEKNNGTLDLICSLITSLPDNLTVEENLLLSYSKIKELPKGLTVAISMDYRVASL